MSDLISLEDPILSCGREPIESFVAAEEMARQFIQSAEKEGAEMDQGGQGVILLDEAKEAFDENGDLRVCLGSRVEL